MCNILLLSKIFSNLYKIHFSVMKPALIIVLQFFLMYTASGIAIRGGRWAGRSSAGVATTTAAPIVKKGRAAAAKPNEAPADKSPGGAAGEGSGSASAAPTDFIKTVQEADFSKVKSHICSSIPIMSGKLANMSLNMELTESEVYELALTNMAYEMSSDSVLTFLPESMRWMKQVLDLLSSITKMTCGSTHIPHEYLNVAKNLFMYYTYKNSFQETMIDPRTGEEIKPEKPDQQIWDSIVDMLSDCNGHATTIEFQNQCNRAQYVMKKDGSLNLIAPSEEQFDVISNDDLGVYGEEVIDAVWLMFSTTYARCYAMKYPNEGIVLNFLDEFKKSFLEPLMPRWRMFRNSYNKFFPIIMGPFDLNMAKDNLRACTSGAYIHEEIPDRQLVRPLQVEIDNQMVPNFKTGRIHN